VRFLGGPLGCRSPREVSTDQEPRGGLRLEPLTLVDLRLDVFDGRVRLVFEARSSPSSKPCLAISNASTFVWSARLSRFWVDWMMKTMTNVMTVVSEVMSMS